MPASDISRVHASDSCIKGALYHVRCNAAGLPIGIVLSEGEAHDVTAYDGLMQQRDSDPGAMLADKG
jgi:transposase